MMPTKFLNNLSSDFLVLLKSGKGRDVAIHVGKDTENETFELHSGILYVRCPYFSNELDELDYNENHIKEISKTNLSAEVFRIIIAYIYGGIVSFEDMDSAIIFESLMTANEFQLEELTKYTENYLIQNHEFWIQTNFSKIYKATIENDNLETLQKYCIDIVAKEPYLLFDSDEFVTLPESAFVSILEREDLQMEESKIWDQIIKWGIAQNPSLPSNQNQWSDLDFLILKTTLKNCLPLIRYFDFDGEEVLEKLRPYQKILDPNLWTDILKKFMTPDKINTSAILPSRRRELVKIERHNQHNISTGLQYKIVSTKSFTMKVTSPPIQKTITSPILKAQRFELESNIISTSHAIEITSWINPTGHRYTNPLRYKFKLLTRGSRDGFNGESFHKECKGYDNTLVILKVSGTGEILGGYNPLMIPIEKERRWLSTYDSFIFSLKNGGNSILSRIAMSDRAIWHNSIDFYGPHFGAEDLVMLGNFHNEERCFCRFKHYAKPIRNTIAKFSVDEYEVFQLQDIELSTHDFDSIDY